MKMDGERKQLAFYLKREFPGGVTLSKKAAHL